MDQRTRKRKIKLKQRKRYQDGLIVCIAIVAVAIGFLIYSFWINPVEKDVYVAGANIMFAMATGFAVMIFSKMQRVKKCDNDTIAKSAIIIIIVCLTFVCLAARFLQVGIYRDIMLFLFTSIASGAVNLLVITSERNLNEAEKEDRRQTN